MGDPLAPERVRKELLKEEGTMGPKRILALLAALVLASGALVFGAPNAAADSHECGGIWITADLGPGDPAVGGSCEASADGATTVSGEAEALVGTTLGQSMSGTVTLEIRDAADDTVLASCTDSRTGAAYTDWIDGDRPSCSVSVSVSGVSAVTCVVSDAVRAGTYGCTLS